MLRRWHDDWCPLRPHYCNGHNWLERRLGRRKMAYQMLDNAFVEIGDWARAQQIADDRKPERLHRRLDEFARRGSRAPAFRIGKLSK